VLGRVERHDVQDGLASAQFAIKADSRVRVASAHGFRIERALGQLSGAGEKAIVAERPKDAILPGKEECGGIGKFTPLGIYLGHAPR